MNNLKKLREKAGLSLGKLSQELEEKKGLKIGRASLSNYERGTQSPREGVWDALADYFNVPITYIMGLSDDIKQPEEMDLKELILKANSKVHYKNDSDSENTTKIKYLTSNIETFTKIIISKIENDYDSNQHIGITVADFLGTVCYLLESEDTNSLSNLNELMEHLTSFNKGIYRGHLIKTVKKEETEKGFKSSYSTSNSADAFEKFMDYSENISNTLNEYFLSEIKKTKDY